MVRYRIKKKVAKSQLKHDAFLDTTESWIERLRAKALPIGIAALVILAVVLLVFWANASRRDRKDKLWSRLYTLNKEAAFTDEVKGRWETLVTDSAGTEVEPFCLMEYGARLVGTAEIAKMEQAKNLYARVEKEHAGQTELAGLAAAARLKIENLLTFQPKSETSAVPQVPAAGTAGNQTSINEATPAQADQPAPGVAGQEAGTVDTPTAPKEKNNSGHPNPGKKKKGSFRAEGAVGGETTAPAESQSAQGDSATDGQAVSTPPGAGASGQTGSTPPGDGAAGQASVTPAGNGGNATAPAAQAPPQGPATNALPSDKPASEAKPSEAEQIKQRKSPPP